MAVVLIIGSLFIASLSQVTGKQSICSRDNFNTVCSLYNISKFVIWVYSREWHGNGECGNTAVTAVITNYRGDG